MIIIADTSSINYLVLIEAVDVLRELYGEVTVPEAVVTELKRGKTPKPVSAWIENHPSWLKVERAIVPEADEALKVLGPGEREAIALAEAFKEARLIIDERNGREEAERRGIPVTGVFGVLDDAGERGLIDVSEKLNRLEHETTFRASARLFQYFRDRDADRKRLREHGRLEPGETKDPSPQENHSRNHDREIER